MSVWPREVFDVEDHGALIYKAEELFEIDVPNDVDGALVLFDPAFRMSYALPLPDENGGTYELRESDFVNEDLFREFAIRGFTRYKRFWRKKFQLPARLEDCASSDLWRWIALNDGR